MRRRARGGLGPIAKPAELEQHGLRHAERRREREEGRDRNDQRHRDETVVELEVHPRS